MLRLFALDSGSENRHWQELDLAAGLDRALGDHQGDLVVKDLELEFGLDNELLPVWANDR
jgi:hypothetical protein